MSVVKSWMTPKVQSAYDLHDLDDLPIAIIKGQIMGSAQDLTVGPCM